MKRGERDVVSLRDVGSGLLVTLPGEQQVDPVRQRRQRRVHVAPALVAEVPHLAPQPAQVLDLPEAAEEGRPEGAVDIQPRLRLQPVSDRRQTGRLGETDEVWRDRHPDVVPSSQQFATDNDGRLDITASPVAGQHKLHGQNLAFLPRAYSRRQRTGHYRWFADAAGSGLCYLRQYTPVPSISTISAVTPCFVR